MCFSPDRRDWEFERRESSRAVCPVPYVSVPIVGIGSLSVMTELLAILWRVYRFSPDRRDWEFERSVHCQ